MKGIAALLVLAASPWVAAVVANAPNLSIPFSASIVPEGPIEFRGNLTSTGDETFSLLLDARDWRGVIDKLAATPVYEASQAWVKLEHRERATVAGQETPQRWDEHGVVLYQVKVFVESLGPEARWALISAQPSTHALQLGTRDRCAVAPSVPRDFRFPGGTPHFAQGLWSADATTLRVNCQIRFVDLTGFFHMFFYDTKLGVAGYDETGAYRSFSLETGHTDAGVDWPIGARADVHRYASVRSAWWGVNQTAKFRVIGDANATFESLKWAFVGDMHVPRSTGAIEWGPWKNQNESASFNATGFFAASSGGADLIVLRGQTWDGPSMSAAQSINPPRPMDWAAFVAGAAMMLSLVGVVRFLPPIAGVFYARVTGAEALRHPMRRRIMDAVRAEPGITIDALSCGLGMRRSTLRYHLGVLGSFRLVESERVHHSTALFPYGRYNRLEKMRLFFQRDPRMQRLVTFLAARPGARQREVAEALGFSQSQVSKLRSQLRRLNLA